MLLSFVVAEPRCRKSKLIALHNTMILLLPRNIATSRTWQISDVSRQSQRENIGHKAQFNLLKAMEAINQLYDRIRRLDMRRTVIRPAINFGFVIATALFLYNTLKIIVNTEAPITVVLSGSMEPGFYRGDILFLYHSPAPVTVGEIVVYKIPGKEVPIVHRVLQIHRSNSGESLILTKGDNNPGDDRPIFYETDPTLNYLTNEHIMGRVYGYIPYVGYVSIVMFEYPMVKFILLAVIALYTIFSGGE